VPGFWCSAQHFGNILAIFKPVVGDFYEHFSNQGFFDSLVGRSHPQKGNHGNTDWQVLELWKND
jgi:hypothetical protein